MAETYLGIDIGGSNTKICVVDLNFKIIETMKCPTDKSIDIVDFAIRLVKKYLYKYKDIQEVCFGVPGIVDTKKNLVHTAPSIINSPRDLKAELQSKINVPVFINNDVTCWAMSEGVLGACKNINNYILITLGTGIGASIVIDNKVYDGYDFAAGEIGYMVFLEDLDNDAKLSSEFGSFESKVSGAGIIKNYTKLIGQDKSINQIYQDFKDGNNKTAQDYVAKKWDYLAVGIANVITILHPQAVVIGGGITQQWDYVSQELSIRLKKLISTNTKLIKSQTGEYGGALGAIIAAKK